MAEVPTPPATLLEGFAAFRELLVVKGLYSWIDLKTPIGMSVQTVLRRGVFLTFDLYCVHCKMLTPWTINPGLVQIPEVVNRYPSGKPLPQISVYHATCQRVQHFYTFVIHEDSERVTKIGQLPATGDLAFAELKVIDRGLDKRDRSELGRALGLFSHDAAAGAFVYLRRVFERMIDRAHERHGTATGAAVPDFGKLRMEDRIAAISDQLPPDVVADRAVFKLLSLGLHELSDEQCKVLFPVTKAVIFQMLAEEERQRSEAALKATTKAALTAALNEFGGGVTRE